MKNYNDIIQTLIETNDKLIKGEIDIEKVKVIGQKTQTLINAAKVQLEFARQSKQDAKFFIDQPAEDTEIEDESSVDCFDPKHLIE
jgi:NACalpha-BTF3-like transcription factor